MADTIFPFRKIMVVEDEPFLLKIISTVLRADAPEVEITLAADGVEALEKLRDFTPDVLLVDVLMPNMDGISFVKRLQQDTATAHIPVIFATAMAQEINFQPILKQHNVVGVISKPYSVETLVPRISAMVSEYLSKRP